MTSPNGISHVFKGKNFQYKLGFLLKADIQHRWLLPESGKPGATVRPGAGGLTVIAVDCLSPREIRKLIPP